MTSGEKKVWSEVAVNEPRILNFRREVVMLKSKLKLAVALLVSFSASAALHAQDLNKKILAQETKVWESFVGTKPNAEAFGRLLTPDYVCIEPTGVLVDKQGNIAELAALTFSSFQIQDPQVKVLAPDTALIVSRVRYEGTVHGQKVAGETLSATIWVKRGDQWLAQFHSETFKK
jgi:hypothetical protein